MNKKHIVFACKGNIGRSPVAELIGNQYLKGAEAQSEYIISSRGTITDLCFAGLLPANKTKDSISIFRASGLDDICFRAYEDALDSGDSLSIQARAKEVMQYCAKVEMDKRDAILKELGIQGSPSRAPRQLVAYEPVDVLFAIDRTVHTEATTIYTNALQNPAIHLLSAFATGQSDAKDSAVDLTRPESVWDSYRASLIRIIEHTPLALRKIIGA